MRHCGRCVIVLQLIGRIGLSAAFTLGFLPVSRNFTKPSSPHRCHKALVEVMSGELACHLGISLTGLKSSVPPFKPLGLVQFSACGLRSVALLALSHFLHKILSNGPVRHLARKERSPGLSLSSRAESYSLVRLHPAHPPNQTTPIPFSNTPPHPQVARFPPVSAESPPEPLLISTNFQSSNPHIPKENPQRLSVEKTVPQPPAPGANPPTRYTRSLITHETCFPFRHTPGCPLGRTAHRSTGRRTAT